MALTTSQDPSRDIDILSMVQQRWQRQVSASAIYSFLLTPITIISARKGHVAGMLTLTETHVNSKGGLHGSVSATIVDAFADWRYRVGMGGRRVGLVLISM
jgi:exo-beta-1,3-glucanase (GH17 family)